MTRIIKRRQDARPDEAVLELRVFEAQAGDIRGAVMPVDFIGDHAMIEAMSEPVKRAFADALELCNKEKIPALWVHDPKGAFPLSLRPVENS
jgi:hypothetical protein